MSDLVKRLRGEHRAKLAGMVVKESDLKPVPRINLEAACRIEELEARVMELDNQLRNERLRNRRARA